MSKPKDPAIIHSNVQGPRSTSDGHDITLRDLFAAFALAGLNTCDSEGSRPSSREAAKAAYGDADAMLAEREKTG